MNGIAKKLQNWKFFSLFLLIPVLVIWQFNTFKLTVILGVAAIVFVMLFIAILESNTIALVIIFTTAFTRVIFYLVGLPRAVPTLFTEFCVLLLLAKALYLRLYLHRKALRAFGFFPMLGILLVMLLSYFINKSETLPAIFFFRQTFIFFLFFIALQNLDISTTTIAKINKYIIFLFLMQLPAAAIKFIIHGPEEGLGIGTVSWQAGEFSTTLPLFAMSFLLAFYFFNRNKKYILLIFGFLLFGIVGQKRALALLIPILGIVIWYLYGKGEKFKKAVKLRVTQLKYLFIVCIIGYLGVLASVHLLEDEMYGGRLDVKKVFDYIIWYNTRNQIALHGSSNPDHTMGRFTIIGISMEKLWTGGIINQLFGFGPGSMIRSHHLGRKENVFKQFGIRGNYPGFVVFVLQNGFLGVILLTYFFLKLFKRVRMKYQKSDNSDFKMLSLGFLGATFVFMLDFFIYSQSTLFFGVLTPIYFYIATIVLNGDSNFSLFDSFTCQHRKVQGSNE